MENGKLFIHPQLRTLYLTLHYNSFIVFVLWNGSNSDELAKPCQGWPNSGLEWKIISLCGLDVTEYNNLIFLCISAISLLGLLHTDLIDRLLLSKWKCNVKLLSKLLIIKSLKSSKLVAVLFHRDWNCSSWFSSIKLIRYSVL